MQKVTAIFDIGKTNKKFFLFDVDYREVYREYIRFDEIEDEDGFPTENLETLCNWCQEVIERMLKAPEYDIIALNFSCYGASLVHVDDQGTVLTPLYNYLKPIDQGISTSFYEKYGPEDGLSKVTGSLKLGMLNSGMQLYWLKNTKPSVFEKIKYTMHLPQYLSFLFTGVATSEFTNIGCHTILWDYEKKKYHNWVYEEKIDKILPPLTSAEKTISTNINGKKVEVGIGIHDSSAALLPYLRSVKKPFILISTGTWSISINPFTKDRLSLDDIRQDCIYNMRVDGNPVKASRLFLGNEYKIQVKYLTTFFGVALDYHKSVDFHADTFLEIIKDFKYMFHWAGISSTNMPDQTKYPYDSFELAYHQLMTELVILQMESIKTAIGNDKIEELYVDGGFSGNDVYIKILSHYLRNMNLWTTDSSLGSALGAAIVISGEKLNAEFLSKNCGLRKQAALDIIQ